MYRIGAYTAYEHEDGTWRMGRLVDPDNFGAFHAGTVTDHRTLRECVAVVKRRKAKGEE